jgi:hypothetical protein
MASKKPGTGLIGFDTEMQEQPERTYKDIRQERLTKEKEAAAKKPRDRRHKVFMMTPEQADQLDSYCFHGKTTIQATILEALDMLYRSKGLPGLKEEK